MAYPFQLVDVFGARPFTGNPLAVVHAATDLSTAQMQQITQWLNFSETTFLLPPDNPAADYRVRIFTPALELPFAGHPTLGTAHAWLAGGYTPKNPNDIIQECEAGLITLRRTGGRLAFAAPPLIRAGAVDCDTIEEIAAFLRIPRAAIQAAQWVDNGPGWIAVMLDSAEAVLAVDPVRDYPERVDLGLVGPHAPGGDAAWELRAFFSNQHGAIVEDPVTGSLNASVAQWLFGSGRASGAYVAAQGTKLGRLGRIHVSQEDGKIWIAGNTVTISDGVLPQAP